MVNIIVVIDRVAFEKLFGKTACVIEYSCINGSIDVLIHFLKAFLPVLHGQTIIRRNQLHSIV